MSANFSRAPQPREVAGRERRRLAAVVPAPERADEDRPLERRALVDPELASHSSKPTAARQRAQAGARATYASARLSAQIVAARNDVDEHEPPGQRVAVLHLADDRLRDEHREQHDPRAGRCPGSSPRSRQRSQPTTRTPIPNAAATRTWT